MNTNEQYLALFGTRENNIWIAKGEFPTEGQPSSVHFNMDEVLARKDELIGFYHTHPNFSNQYSQTDRITMEGWVDMLGKPLVCLIDGINGLIGYWCENKIYEYTDSSSVKEKTILIPQFEMTVFDVTRIGDFFTNFYNG